MIFVRQWGISFKRIIQLYEEKYSQVEKKVRVNTCRWFVSPTLIQNNMTLRTNDLKKQLDSLENQLTLLDKIVPRENYPDFLKRALNIKLAYIDFSDNWIEKRAPQHDTLRELYQVCVEFLTLIRYFEEWISLSPKRLDKIPPVWRILLQCSYLKDDLESLKTGLELQKRNEYIASQSVSSEHGTRDLPTPFPIFWSLWYSSLKTVFDLYNKKFTYILTHISDFPPQSSFSLGALYFRMNLVCDYLQKIAHQFENDIGEETLTHFNELSTQINFSADKDYSINNFPSFELYHLCVELYQFILYCYVWFSLTAASMLPKEIVEQNLTSFICMCEMLKKAILCIKGTLKSSSFGRREDQISFLDDPVTGLFENLSLHN